MDVIGEIADHEQSTEVIGEVADHEQSTEVIGEVADHEQSTERSSGSRTVRMLKTHMTQAYSSTIAL